MSGKRSPVEIVAREGVRFTVPGPYGDQKIGGRWSRPSFEEAVAAARSTIRRIEYPGQHPDHVYTRACVALRMSTDYAEIFEHSSGTDSERLRWEVFRDRVVLVPPEQGGLTDEQKSVALGDRFHGRWAPPR